MQVWKQHSQYTKGCGEDRYRLWIEGGVFSCLGGDQWYVGQQRVTLMTQILEGSSLCYRGKVAATRAPLDKSRTGCVFDKTPYTQWWQLLMLEAIAYRLQTRLVCECRGFTWRCSWKLPSCREVTLRHPVISAVTSLEVSGCDHPPTQIHIPEEQNRPAVRFFTVSSHSAGCYSSYL
jgi:hypothetical protein